MRQYAILAGLPPLASCVGVVSRSGIIFFLEAVQRPFDLNDRTWLGIPAELLVRLIVAAMQDERRGGDLGKKKLYVYLIDHLANPVRVLRRGSDVLKILEPLHLFWRRLRDETRGDDLSKRRVFQAPSVSHEGQHGLRLLDYLWRSTTEHTSGVSAIQHKVRNTFRMPHRIGDGDCRFL